MPLDIGFSYLGLWGLWLQDPADCGVKPWAGSGPPFAHLPLFLRSGRDWVPISWRLSSLVLWMSVSSLIDALRAP